ncbi:hypothetical protein EXIGLDRAFT_768409 [Exidia glandulosa HHB12029]|uniref:Uncharacterized protein n=1 Tax=Exidia glandulosa HHB12029 TaxID=1314781 RepID=A0A166ALB6_EXIGL|nr:hypothetical protein EXIGLDRAFT_768409 [Exidia glandulosa HHB12029]
MPLFVPPARPSYPLFIIYLLSLFQAVLGVYLYGIVSSSVSPSLGPVRVLYMGQLAFYSKGWMKVWSLSHNRPSDCGSPFRFPSASEHGMPYIWVYLSLRLTIVALVLSVHLTATTRFHVVSEKQLDNLKFHFAFYFNVICDYWLRYRYVKLRYIQNGRWRDPPTQGVVTSIYYGLLYYVMTENSMNGVEDYIALPTRTLAPSRRRTTH